MNRSQIEPTDLKNRNYRVGILALQGDFALHVQALRKLGCEPVLVKTVQQLDSVERLIIPGGETTTINKLLDIYNLREPLREFGRARPVWGTCAGLIMLAMNAADERVHPLGLIDIDAARNAYGRQVFSFSDYGEINLNGSAARFKMVFIRAPKIVRIGESVEVLGKLGDEIVMVRQGNILVTSFHPELTDNTLIHKYFLKI